MGISIDAANTAAGYQENDSNVVQQQQREQETAQHPKFAFFVLNVHMIMHLLFGLPIPRAMSSEFISMSLSLPGGVTVSTSSILGVRFCDEAVPADSVRKALIFNEELESRMTTR